MVVNSNYYCSCFLPADLASADLQILRRSKAAVLKNSKWQPGSSITIGFLEGDAGLQKRVQAVAMEWTQVANLDFVFKQNAATDIRIAFAAGKGSWSYIGTVCRTIPNGPTMNYGWLTPDSSDVELRRVVLHEFGHAVGLIHEHQNPKGGIDWNRPAVIHDLSGPPNNWDEATIENNMFHYYPPGDLDATDVDPTSIMMYPIPSSWTLDGFSTGLNGELSATDRAPHPKCLSGS